MALLRLSGAVKQVSLKGFELTRRSQKHAYVGACFETINSLLIRVSPVHTHTHTHTHTYTYTHTHHIIKSASAHVQLY